MNILRKKRKYNIKIRLKRIILLIFSLIMTTFAWITYSRILNSEVQIDINSWNLSFYVDRNNNNIAEETEEQENPIAVDLSDLYPGMEEKIVKVIIRNNGDAPTDILYTSSEVNILGEEYTILNTAPEGEEEHYILKHNPVIGTDGITTVDFINEPERFPFKITIEHTQEILPTTEGYLNIKVSWPLKPTYPEGATKAEKEAADEQKDILDTKWGYQVAKYLEDNKDNPDVTGAFHAKVRINAIGKPRSDYNNYFINHATSENYGDLVNYPIDLDGNENTPDWKVFYNNGKNIYLIASDYMLNSKIPEQTLSDLYMATEEGQPYYIHFPYDEENGNDLRLYNKVINDNDVINKFMLQNMNKFSADNWNYKQTAALVDTEKWSFLLDGTYADSAVAAPSIEMYIASWNSKGYTELDIDFGNVGFLIGKKGDNLKDIALDSNNEGGFQIDLSTDIGRNDSLYYPDSLNSVSKVGYALSAPSAIGTQGHAMLYVRFDGKIYRTYHEYSPLGLRPVICLKSNVMAEKDENNIWNLKISDLQTNVNYSTTDETEEAVTVTIKSNKEIVEFPEDWSYVDENIKDEIYKVYTSNATEYPVIKDKDNFETTVEVIVKNINAKELRSSVIGNESLMYGAYTDYPVDIDNNLNDNDWRIFYADETTVYLIADDYVLNSMVPVESLGMKKFSKYTAFWENTDLGLTLDLNSKYFTMRDETQSLINTFKSSNENYQATAALLDTSKWTNFVNSDYATDAVGGPTLEMWVSSWNQIYPDDKLYCNNGNENGYNIGKENMPTEYEVNLSTSSGYDNTLYFPHKERIDYIEKLQVYGCSAYWLSSPSSLGEKSNCFVGYYGGLSRNVITTQEKYVITIGLRPIVALKSEIKAVNENDIWYLSD